MWTDAGFIFWFSLTSACCTHCYCCVFSSSTTLFLQWTSTKVRRKLNTSVGYECLVRQKIRAEHISLGENIELLYLWQHFRAPTEPQSTTSSQWRTSTTARVTSSQFWRWISSKSLPCTHDCDNCCSHWGRNYIVWTPVDTMTHTYISPSTKVMWFIYSNASIRTNHGLLSCSD